MGVIVEEIEAEVVADSTPPNGGESESSGGDATPHHAFLSMMDLARERKARLVVD